MQAAHVPLLPRSQKLRLATDRHLVEPEPDGNFKPEDVDPEGAAVTPKAEDGSNLFENSVPHEPSSMEMDGRDGEQVHADEAMEALNIILIKMTWR